MGQENYVFRSESPALAYAVYLSFINIHKKVDNQFSEHGIDLRGRSAVAYLTNHLFNDIPQVSGELEGLVGGSAPPNEVEVNGGEQPEVNLFYGSGECASIMTDISTVDDYLSFCREKRKTAIFVVEDGLWLPEHPLIARLEEIATVPVVDIGNSDLKYFKSGHMEVTSPRTIITMLK